MVIYPGDWSEIRPSPTDAKVCQRLGKLAAAKIEELVKPAEL